MSHGTAGIPTMSQDGKHGEPYGIRNATPRANNATSAKADASTLASRAIQQPTHQRSREQRGRDIRHALAANSSASNTS